MDFDHEIFSTVILSLPLIQEGAVVKFWRKNVHKYWLTAQRIKLAKENVIR